MYIGLMSISATAMGASCKLDTIKIIIIIIIIVIIIVIIVIIIGARHHCLRG